MNQKEIDKAMRLALKRRLKEADPKFNVAAWKRGWYSAGRKLAARSKT